MTSGNAASPNPIPNATPPSQHPSFSPNVNPSHVIRSSDEVRQAEIVPSSNPNWTNYELNAQAPSHVRNAPQATRPPLAFRSISSPLILRRRQTNLSGRPGFTSAVLDTSQNQTSWLLFEQAMENEGQI